MERTNVRSTILVLLAYHGILVFVRFPICASRNDTKVSIINLANYKGNRTILPHIDMGFIYKFVVSVNIDELFRCIKPLFAFEHCVPF